MSVFQNVAIVGMHFRPAGTKELVASFIPPLQLELEREPTNEFDSYAIKAIYVMPDGTRHHIGYVERGQAMWIAPLMDQGRRAFCTVDSLEQRRKNLHPICTISAIE